MKLGAVIRALREERQWSIDALVEQIGEVKGGDRASLSKIENDQRWPRPELMEAIAAAFDMRVYQIIAKAEDVELPIARVGKDERELLREYRAMEPDVREHYAAIARAMVKK